MDCSADNRLVIAGGSVMNAAAAGILFLVGRNARRTSPHLKYFAWLSMTVNLLDAAGYLAFSGIGGFGDWAIFIQGFSPQWAWRMGLSIAGVGAYVLCARWSLLELRPLVGGSAQRHIVTRRLCIPPYLAGGTVECLAGAFNPQRWFLVVMSAAAPTFGGKSALIWGPEWLRGSSFPNGSGRDACSHSEKLGVDRCGHRHRRLLYFRARPGRTLRGSRRALKFWIALAWGSSWLGKTGVTNRVLIRQFYEQ